MIAAETPVAPVSAVVIPPDFGNWEGKLNSGRVKSRPHMPDPAVIGQELADVSAVNELLADPRLDVFEADPSEGQPYTGRQMNGPESFL